MCLFLLCFVPYVKKKHFRFQFLKREKKKEKKWGDDQKKGNKTITANDFPES